MATGFFIYQKAKKLGLGEEFSFFKEILVGENFERS